MDTKMKYWRLKIEGERSPEEMQSVVGRFGGLMLRMHVEGGVTQVYFYAQEPAAAAGAKALAEAWTPEEVSAEEVTNLR